jgi:ribosomal protein L34E
MPLINFGSILTFAEEIECQQLEFCNKAMNRPQCADIESALKAIAKSAQKRISEVRRVRRENVTEMILETIQGFHRKPFLLDLPDPSALPQAEINNWILKLGDNAGVFYEKAAEKLKGQAEVARALKGLKKKHAKDLKSFSKE